MSHGTPCHHYIVWEFFSKFPPLYQYSVIRICLCSVFTYTLKLEGWLTITLKRTDHIRSTYILYISEGLNNKTISYVVN